MKFTHTATVLLLAALAILLVGCVACELRITNQTGGAIQFYTGHTRETVQIPAGATKAIPHTAGQLSITSQQGKVWKYDNVDITEYGADTSKGFKRLTLPLTVGADGVLSLPSGRKISPVSNTAP
jgi:hypothetical protein